MAETARQSYLSAKSEEASYRRGDDRRVDVVIGCPSRMPISTFGVKRGSLVAYAWAREGRNIDI